ncbi:hypothetical protein [Vibrio breoganii]|uniref:hypothetical protein n=1 Tax=Vibrio breoganii TaxID=553239 RepID=UPI000C842438|nr:hypothetical protein [Vibrio breoganii]PMG89723.1 hypothetical protein BCU79_18450 [Vibrio breoganii]PMM80289.1 hypothetical protein BCT45_15220 [Vibrio breoganii]TKG15354.1 hypothetical protein FCV81_17215 [Vibrio breoganii]
MKSISKVIYLLLFLGSSLGYAQSDLSEDNPNGQTTQIESVVKADEANIEAETLAEADESNIEVESPVEVVESNIEVESAVEVDEGNIEIESVANADEGNMEAESVVQTDEPNMSTKAVPNTDKDTADVQQNVIEDRALIAESHITAVSETNSLLVTLLIVMSGALLISVAISFYLYKWRKVLLSDSKYALPEEMAKAMQGFELQLSKHTEQTNFNSQRVDLLQTEISRMTQTYMDLQKELTDKDVEIKRLRNGYDLAIYKKFIRRFIRIDQQVTDLKFESDTDQFDTIAELLEDAFAESGIEKFEPQIGDDYRNCDGVEDRPKVVPTQDKEKDYQIEEVLEPGYKPIDKSNKEALVKSKVKIFKFSEE